MPTEGAGREVVLVHGLWLRGWAMAVLGWRLRKAGFRTRSFSYATTRQELGQQVEKLHRFALAGGGGMPHFVAHSMGGLITVQMLERFGGEPSGRVVLMGSPLRGSSVASRVSEWPGGKALLGAAQRTLIEGVQNWPNRWEIGMIAGTQQVGIGVVAGGAADRSDGTVLEHESRHDGLDDYIEISTSHTGLLVSPHAARQAIAFLEHGTFAH